MTDMKFGWRREDSTAASNVSRKNTLYQKARPPLLFDAPDILASIRNIADDRMESALRSAAASKAINAKDKSVLVAYGALRDCAVRLKGARNGLAIRLLFHGCRIQ